ncbi:MAG: shikimate dehydrogenase [Candidatus Altiarchaeum hamiconexum]|uniref:Shikimate dehydrogenase (NADP(+)) n=1 Tax=Candidatus Altarchaeum hamiconexum TaxID=1803513 RepID=A0A8J8CFM2_9ARCH|nr:shikimate dehydrogenase [Candidatus Altarchaeum hamiconexum]OIQ04804.1 MAG: shikimate dehydrogenase [Candidatus Altarchaeum sp. CG2_30_32_3053]PIN67435.1 MAG: shikimate dehydrogenase [Candidatus Altarchaeum sp. CG12_big_fil_rev_8_21_14_0_65_33_22]PIV27753.1 MAG: shikimate dehydrogenase [Candidatus Altarchaeum sp. CG03_land_8_20_14_0_80_32_618]PIX48298.1 MAG: shikimate dehydrogenase [Candidatus Altarchaeum sp. CG_4_8_14_3_um_filter_33_2054]PIZ30885.1 MAG: shikimate dehydrogenase [Candidatus 
MTGSKTKIFGVLGHPIGHSLSPVMHKAFFKEKKINADYFAFDVDEKNLGDAIHGADALKFCGLNVTIPHKISVIKYMDEISEEARLINAVNTIKFDYVKDLIIGYNTDGIGAINAIEKNLNDGLKGKKIFILGAGGAARAIIFSALSNNAEISIYNRTVEKAILIGNDVKEKLNKYLKVVHLKNLKDELKDNDIIINATSVGMFPNADECPINEYCIPKGKVVMDIVYNPIETKFLESAKKRNCMTINGVDMLVEQGAEALKIWLNMEPEEYLINIMKKSIIKKLKNKPKN